MFRIYFAKAPKEVTVKGKKIKKTKPERLEENLENDTESVVWSCIQLANVEITLLQYIYQKSRRPGRKPKIGITLLSKCIKQTEWIVNIFTVFTKMISVILLF